MKLYVIRHGKTKLNNEGKYNGHFDEDIIEEGIRQAEKIKDSIEKLKIDLIICSPLLRAKHTCEIINSKKIPVLYDERLIDRECGILTGKKIDDFFETDFLNYYSSKKIEDLESLPHVFDRVTHFLNEIKVKYYEKNILIITHACIARCIYFYFNKMPEDGIISKCKIDNCKIMEFDF